MVKAFKLKKKQNIKNNTSTNKIRLGILIFFFLLFTVFSLRHFILGGKVAASVDALCPFGGFETLGTLIFSGGFVPQILLSSLVLAIGVIIITLLFRKGFCGYICPFGTLQELLYKIKSKRIEISKKIDEKGRYLKYIILALILLGTFFIGKLVFKAVDPFATFFHFGKGLFWSFEPAELVPHSIAFVILMIILVLSVFIDRFFCKYLCPLGGVLSLFAKLSPTNIFRSTKGKNKCIDCKICDKACPMVLKPSKEQEMKKVECINCNKCIEVCPKKSLNINFFRNSLTIGAYIIIILVIFFGTIGVAKYTDNWESVPVLNNMVSDDEFNPEMIKGWMTIAEVSEASGMPLTEITEKSGVPLDMVNIPMKELKDKVTGFETEIIREIIVTHNEHQKSGGCPDSNNNVAQDHDIDCPWGIENETVRRCGLWEDKDNNGVCDLSE